MHRWTICVPVPKDSTTIDGSRKICFLIPQIVPWPLRSVRDPREPFVMHLDQEIARKLQALATIDAIASELPSDISREIQGLIATQMEALGQNLGNGLTLSRHAQAS